MAIWKSVIYLKASMDCHRRILSTYVLPYSYFALESWYLSCSSQISFFTLTYVCIIISFYAFHSTYMILPFQAFHRYPDIMATIQKQGFSKPSPIQAQAWPYLLSGKDLIGIAQTGTGKTLAFLMPIFIHIDLQTTPR